MTGPAGDERLLPETTRQTVRRLVDVSKTRARLFDRGRHADRRQLRASSGPAARSRSRCCRRRSNDNLAGQSLVTRLYDWVVSLLRAASRCRLYQERGAAARRGLSRGRPGARTARPRASLRGRPRRRSMLTVAVPVQRYRQVLGALMLSAGGNAIDDRGARRAPRHPEASSASRSPSPCCSRSISPAPSRGRSGAWPRRPSACAAARARQTDDSRFHPAAATRSAISPARCAR